MVVFCTYCGQQFTRDEHLERHILTHTNVKPWRCETCHMSFARRDLLQRHFTVHGRDHNNQEGLPPNNGLLPKSAGRTPIACLNCAKTKTKCDKKFPCTRCAGRNLKCTLRPTRRQSKQQVRVPEQLTGNSQGNMSSSTERVVMPSPMTSDGNSPQGLSQSFIQNEMFQLMSDHTSPIEQKLPSDAPYFDPGSQVQLNGLLLDAFSPLPTPDVSFISQRPISAYDGFLGVENGVINGSQYNVDWSQMQLPLQYDGMVGASELMLMSPVAMDMSTDSMGPIIHGLPGTAQYTQTPRATPQLERSMSEMDIGGSTETSFHRQHYTSPRESDTSADLVAALAAQESWSCFRCTAPTAALQYRKTTALNLEKLEHILQDRQLWSNWESQRIDNNRTGSQVSVTPIQETTYERLNMTTQTFISKALSLHWDGTTSLRKDSPCSSISGVASLPPARVLDAFLFSYATDFEQFFPLSPKGVLDCNELITRSSNEKTAALLIMMMVAQGARSLSTTDTYWLSTGLTEVCRTSLVDLTEKSTLTINDPATLHSALLFTVQAAWSGDKWQMDVATGQRAMFVTMLRHRGSLEPRHVLSPPSRHIGNENELWCNWLKQEKNSRLIYSWAMVDQDMSLFHDTAPLFAVTEFGSNLPDDERLWQAEDAGQWSMSFNALYTFPDGQRPATLGNRPASLRDLFSLFLADEVLSRGLELTPFQLRLLLHPLHAMAHQHCQILYCLPTDPFLQRQVNDSATLALGRARLEEVQRLLQRWRSLADRQTKQQPICAMMRASLVMFHLISLNTVTNFPEIERLARQEDFDGTYEQLILAHSRCVMDVEEAIFHCGQVLRLVRQMPRSIRPPWWAGAIYRAGLILWVDSLTHNDTIAPTASSLQSVPGPSFAIDSLVADHPLLQRYLTKREGVPMLTKCDGSQFPIDNGFAVLNHCIDVLNEGISTRFSDGIRSRLQRLAQG